MKKYYITTALPYVNSSPHLGFALELVQADVLARYHRLLGDKVFFLTGTDEHGAKIVKSAQEAKKPVRLFVNTNARKFIQLTKVLNISNDDFIRTTDKKRHWPAVHKVWLKLQERGDLYKKKYKGLYCLGHEAFITSKDLEGGVCSLHKIKPEIIEEENYFFRLSKYTSLVKKAIISGKMRVFPEHRAKEILKLAEEGFEDISFSRPRKDLKWGIPVPDDPNHTIYVWGDALVNYISALGYARNSSTFRKFWPADVHCIGKDILRFHAAIWPGMLLALGLPLPKTIFVHGFITSGGQKMSKTLGNVVDPFELVNKYGVDAVRYYLLREISPTEDGDFTYERFEERYNADLANGLGNLVSRVVALGVKCKSQIENRKVQSANRKAQGAKYINRIWKRYRKALDEFRFNDAMSAIWDLISWCDKYINEKKPWENNDPKVIYNLLFALANIASMLYPILPQSSENIFHQLGTSPSAKIWKFKPQKGGPLFPRLK